MEKNQVKIVCNPYSKRIQYYWLEENGRWVDLCESEDSALNVDRFTVDASLSRNAFALLDVLSKNYYNKSVGLRIIFEGTEDDFTDLDVVRKSHFSDYDIELIKGSRRIKLAKDAMPEIETIFSEVEDYFKEYPDADTEAVISKYRETVRPEIALCIMGLYSSGKSAFINSLLGKELLPSDSDPATAKVYKIEEGSKLEIRFNFMDEEYLIEYSGNKWKSSKNLNNEILKIIKTELDGKEDLSEDYLMYWTLYALNKYAKLEGDKQHKELVNASHELLKNAKSLNSDDEYIEELLKKYRIRDLVNMGKVSANKLGAVICVQTTFLHSTLPLDKFKFVIYDTPGSNSVQFREHADVLKESLEQQTNGLPIFVTTPDSMDEKDNKEIIAIINELGGALDISNMMLIINKSDEKSKSTLQKKAENQDNLVLTKWKANRAYFVSSIVGLGAKKENAEEEEEWIDDDYYTIFLEKMSKFSDSSSKLYLRLFEYNILPIDAKERIEERISSISEEELLLWNSGIPCVEEEIGTFAQKYALYNKCAEAIKHLSTAVASVSETVDQTRKEAEQTRREVESELEKEKKALIERLKKECESAKKAFAANFAEKVTASTVGKFIAEERIKEIVEGAYNTTSGKNDHEKLNGFNDKIEACLKRDIKDYATATSKNISDYWADCADKLREKLMRIVVDSPELTDDQKEALKKVVLEVVKVNDSHKQLNIKNTDAVSFADFKFLWIWYWTTIDTKISANKYKDALNWDIAENNKTAATGNEVAFGNWITKLLTELDAVVASFNPKLIEKTTKLNHQIQVVEKKNKQKTFIQNSIKEMSKLLSFEEL